MMKLFRSGIAMLLVLVLALSLVACTGNNEPTNPTETQGTEPSETTLPTEGTEPVAENAVTSFSMTYAPTYDNNDYISAYDDGMGGVYVEFVGDEKKVGTLSTDIFATITAALAETKLAELNGQEVYEAGDAAGSMYIEFADGTFLNASFSGNIPQEFIDGYNAMVDCFKTLTADMEVYVAQAQVMGEVNPDVLPLMQEILNTSGIEGQDRLQIADVVMDDYFGFTVGLSSAEGITGATNCAPMMTSVAYSMTIVTLESEDMIETIRADYKATLADRQWVCGMPEYALMAQMDNMVLFLYGSDTMFQQTATAIENAGWTGIETIEVGR